MIYRKPEKIQCEICKEFRQYIFEDGICIFCKRGSGGKIKEIKSKDGMISNIYENLSEI